MELKNRPVQLDMFAREKKEILKRASFYERLCARVALSWENIIVIAIFLSLAVLLSFSFGVEKGRRQAQRESGLWAGLARPEQKQEAVAEMKNSVAPSSRPTVKAAKGAPAAPFPKISAGEIFAARPAGNTVAGIRKPGAIDEAAQGKYIIQVASFQKETSARDEESRLKSQGYKTMLRPSGTLYALCVGAFNDKGEAESIKAKLKSRYEDCFIRRL